MSPEEPVLNCDSFGNFDPYGNGGNADGFAPKLNVGEGNVFRGCRAWHNSDDGWDLYNRNDRPLKPVTIDQCWAFDNGYTEGGYLSTNPSPVLAGQGNGNGFKLGGGDGLAANHVITRSVAFGNRVRGFDENNNVGNITVKNDTAWLNGTMNFAFSEGGVHTFINDLSYLTKSEDEHVGSDVSNAWTGVNAADFVSLDRSLATAPRQPDGTAQCRSAETGAGQPSHRCRVHRGRASTVQRLRARPGRVRDRVAAVVGAGAPTEAAGTPLIVQPTCEWGGRRARAFREHL